MPEGNIGVIGASGTGIQELCSQIALAGEELPTRLVLAGATSAVKWAASVR